MFLSDAGTGNNKIYLQVAEKYTSALIRFSLFLSLSLLVDTHKICDDYNLRAASGAREGDKAKKTRIRYTYEFTFLFEDRKYYYKKSFTIDIDKIRKNKALIRFSFRKVSLHSAK